MIEVEGQDGSVFEFPDGTPRSVIKNAIMKHYGGPSVGAAASMPMQSEVPVTIEPNPNAKTIQGKTFGQKAMGVAEDIGQSVVSAIEAAPTRMQGINRGALEIGLMGGSPQALGLADAAIGRGTIQEQQAKRRYELESTDPLDRGIGNALGIALTAPAGGATTLGQGVRQGAGLGGVLGYNMSDGDLMSTAIGAGAGAGGPVAASLLARAINPVSNYAVQTLRNMGVTPTPGQVLGGAAKVAEDKATSLPVLGSAIQRGQRRALNEFNTASFNEALAPAGMSIPQGTTGREAINAAIDGFGDAYERAIPRSTVVPYTNSMRAQMVDVADSANDLLDDQGLNFIQRQINQITQPGSSGGTSMTGQRAQEILSNLRLQARRHRSGPASDQNIADVLGQIEAVFQEQLEAAIGPERGAYLRAVNSAYAGFKRLEKAAGMVGADEGVFTPAQLQNAVRAMDPSRDKRAFARGTALGQDVSEAGKSVLSQSYPDSGTAGRLGNLVAGGGMISEPMTTLGALGGLGVAGTAYTGPTQRLLANLLAGRQGPGYARAANAVREAGPAAGLGAAASIPYLQGLFQNNPR